MKQKEDVLQDDKAIVFTDGSGEILKIEELRIRTLHDPAISVRKFEKENFAEPADDIFSAAGKEFEAQIRLHRENGLTAFCFRSGLKGRENKEGYPNAFALDQSMEVFLRLEKEAPYMADCQHKAWWTRPVFGSRFLEIPEKTQLLVRKKDESWEIFLAVCGDEFRTDISGSAAGIRVGLSSLRANRKQLAGTAMIHGCGKDPYQVIRSCVKLVKKLRDNAFLELEEKRYPEVFKGMGWCTWDSLGQDVSEEAIFRKMDEFQEKGIRIPWILIDDGWSDVDRGRLTLRGLDADPARFPGGLAQTVKVLKEKYQVSHVGVWQAFKGYWYGIEENSEAHREMAPFLTRYGNGEISVKPAAEASFGFWNRWHSELRRKGIDFVKIDGQGSVPVMLRGDMAEETAVRNLYTGLEASVFLNFDGNLINCMGMAPENVWNRGKSAVSRSSDDYTPTVPGSIVEHTLQNCYNNVYQGDLFAGDWDMFWSDHEEAGFSSILRAISGGPVYISDACGRTRKDVLDRLMRPDGMLLGCDGTARPALDCLTENVLCGGGVLKVYNSCKDVIYIACFTWDISGESVEGILRKKDIPAMKPNGYLVYDHEARSLGRCDETADYVFRMGPRCAKILELVPEEEKVAILGMTDKYIASAAVEDVRGFRNGCRVRVNCGGTFSFAAGQGAESVYLNGREVPYQREGDVYTLKVEGESGDIEIFYS